MRTRPFKQKDGSYIWNALRIVKQENGLWGVWFNYRDKHSSNIRTLKECMDIIDLHWMRKSKKHLRLVENG